MKTPVAKIAKSLKRTPGARSTILKKHQGARLFAQRFLVRPFTGRDRVVRIDAGVWTAPCVDADPVPCAPRIALAGEQETRVVCDTSQLGEHITRDEILAHHHDGIILKAMLLR